MTGARSSCSCFARLNKYVEDRMRMDGDTDTRVRQKALWVEFVGICALFNLAAASTIPSLGVAAVILFALALWSWATRDLNENHLRVATVVGAGVCCYIDMLGSSRWQRGWPVFLCVLDVFLMVEAPRYLTTGLVVFVMVWNIIVELEYNYREMGLFDLPDSKAYEDRRQYCSCEHPPCAQHNNAVTFCANLILVVSVFMTDFLLTRGFADQVLTEKKRMAAAVQAAEDISRSLAGFDLEAAAACLAAAEQSLPEDLHASLQTLLANLGSYRPYLPHSMVLGAQGEDGGGGDSEALSLCASEASGNGSPGSAYSGSRASSAASLGGLAASRFKPRASVAVRQRHPLVAKVVSVVHLTLHEADVVGADLSLDALEAFNGVHAAFLAQVLAAASAHRGIVDGITGGSLIATFNASRPATGPAGKALDMLLTLHCDRDLPACSGAAVLAPAAVGVLGTEALRRPALLGEAPGLAQRLAGYARAAGVGFVCNYGHYVETCSMQAMRVVPDRVWVDGGVEGDAAEGGRRQVIAYELLLSTSRVAKGAEWMYELEASGGDMWSAYNAAGRRLLLGGPVEAGEVWARVEAAERAGRRWDFWPRVDGGAAPAALKVSDVLEGLPDPSS